MDKQAENKYHSAELELSQLLSFEEGQQLLEGTNCNETIVVMDSHLLSQGVKYFILFGGVQGDGLDEAP